MVNKNKIGGIYKIINLFSGDFYIGSTVNLSSRKRAHFYKLNNNTHYNKHLQSAYNLYGKDNFVFKVLLICDDNELVFYEQSLVDLLKPQYNKRIVVESNRGRHLSDEHKQKISVGNCGKKRSDETKKKISASKMGVKISRNKDLVIKVSDEHRNNMSEAAKKRDKHSELTKLKISKSIKEWWQSKKDVSK